MYSFFDYAYNGQLYLNNINELSAFVEAVEKHKANMVSSLESIRNTYTLFETIKPH